MMKKVPTVLAGQGKEEIAKRINAWSGPLVAGIVLLVIAIALFAQCQLPAGKHKKARIRVAPKAMTPVASSSADVWNGNSSSQQTVNSITF